jgi:Predicted O-methyltransferase
MDDKIITGIPGEYEAIKEATVELQFDMASDLYTGSLLKTLAASKPSGRFLELGAGTGLATAWIVSGMDEKSSLIAIENNEILIGVAHKNIVDNRVEFMLADAYEWIRDIKGRNLISFLQMQCRANTICLMKQLQC